MPDNPNIVIDKRLENIKKRIGRLSFLLSHLKRFKEDNAIIDPSLSIFEGAYLFYYYSFSQFILEIYKLFNEDNDEYYTLPKLLNHIESNIKRVGWHKSKVTYPEPTKEQYETGEPVWSKGETKEWFEPAKEKELIEKQALIKELKSKIANSAKDLKMIKTARDKFIAHLDKDFQKHNVKIELDMVEKLFLLAHQIFNKLYQQLKGATFYIDFAASDTLSTIIPITKYYKLRERLITTKLTRETAIPVEELNKILFSNSTKSPPNDH